jgi:DNA repair exonuclease SbcCD nuclease subunit
MSNFWTVSGDPHADNNNIEKIGMLFDIWEEIGNPVLILGDLFDTKEIIRGKIFNYVRMRIRQSKLHFFIMVGNHDWFNLDCLEHSLESFKDLPNVTIIDKPTLIGTTLLMPYYQDIAAFKKALQDLAFAEAEVLFMHQGIIGFDYGNGHVADGNGHGEMDFTVTVRFRKVYSGHFHKFATQGNLMFLGTPFTQDFGESDQTKYLGVFDTATGEMELAETPFPRHRTLGLTLSGNYIDDSQCLMGFIDDHNYWRVRLEGTEAQILSFDQAAWKNVKFLEEPTDADQVENSNIKDTDSNPQKFMVWAKEIKGLDDATIAEGLEILQAS